MGDRFEAGVLVAVDAAGDSPEAWPKWPDWDREPLFLGLSLLAAGWAIVSTRALPVTVGWIALVAGAATLARTLGLDAAFFVSLLLAIVFRIWVGIHLWRSAHTG